MGEAGDGRAGRLLLRAERPLRGGAGRASASACGGWRRACAWEPTGVRPRTHMLLLVEAGGERWLADVGFGADGLLHPGRASSGGGERRSSPGSIGSCTEGADYVLQSWRPRRLVRLICVRTWRSSIRSTSKSRTTSLRRIRAGPFMTMLRVQRPGPERADDAGESDADRADGGGHDGDSGGR